MTSLLMLILLLCLVLWQRDRHAARQSISDLTVVHENARDGLLILCRDSLSAATEGKLILTLTEEDPPVLPGRESLEFPLTEESLGEIRHSAKRLCERAGFSEEKTGALLQCLGEAGMNALRHGGGGVLTLSHDDEAVYCLVSDQGPGIPYDLLPFAVLQKGWSSAQSAGLGFFLILHEADSVTLHTDSRGTHVLITILRTSPDPLEAYLQQFPGL